MKLKLLLVGMNNMSSWKYWFVSTIHFSMKVQGLSQLRESVVLTGIFRSLYWWILRYCYWIMVWEEALDRTYCAEYWWQEIARIYYCPDISNNSLLLPQHMYALMNKSELCVCYVMFNVIEPFIPTGFMIISGIW